MDTIVGLGSAGCNIAEQFRIYPEYDIYKIDVGLKGSRNFNMPPCDTHQEYEENSPNFKKFFNSIIKEKKEVLFVLGGSGKISGAALKILQALKNNEINILYIRPDIDVLGETKKLQEKVVYKVLQEYARSGVFKRLYIASNSCMENIVGDVSILAYRQKLNELLVTAMHMVNVFNHSEPVSNTFETPRSTSRIATVGLMDFEEEKENLFFPLKNIKETRYYYAINQQDLEKPGGLFKKIKKRVKNNKKEVDSTASYGIYSTQYDKKYVYLVAYSARVQD